MATVDAVKAWMTYFGWTRDGGPGSVKLAYGGTIIAKQGDDVWLSDVNGAILRVERDRRNSNQIDEIEASLDT